MNYNKINNITGWIVCLISCAVYLMTKEATVSFWDCGEFAAGAVKLEVVHSPGAPLFLLIGRLFTIIFGEGNGALGVNILSALCSGFTILFLFWTITHFAKRIVSINKLELNNNSIIGIMAAGIVGGLAYTFSDTFWFSAVEAEVYAMSSLLTALVFWTILKWEDSLDKHNDAFGDRWIILIAFILGLSIGVHLLNLLTIPAIVMVYYFKKYTVTLKGSIIAFALGCLITGIVQLFIIQKVPWLCSQIDVLFVNNFGLPFNSGVFFTLISLGVLSYFIIHYAQKNNKYFLYLGTLCFVFIMIGYSTFFQTVIRSKADVPIDMTNPDNAISLVSYLAREQYGAIPHLKGPDFTARPIGYNEGSMKYWQDNKNGKYVEQGKSIDSYKYDSEDERIFPRIWDNNDPSHVSFYRQYLGLAENEKPTAGDNFSFFFNYQVNQMWWRYFCWNYIGRQNDVQNIYGEPQNGNWLSGIKPIDKMFGRGDIDKMPKGLRDSKARNELYFLPFILGLLGLFFQYKYDKENTFIVGLLFFFTGLAIVIYLNNTPIQPRERDYAFAGATYAYAIWIGLGVMMVAELLSKFLKGSLSNIVAGVLCLLAVPILMANRNWDDHDRSHKTLALATAHNYLGACEINAILFCEGDNDTYPLWYAQEVEGYRTDVRVINTSLLGIDWYIDQLANKTNDAAPVPMIWKDVDYRGDLRNQIYYEQNPNLDANASYDLKEILAFVCKNTNPNGNSKTAQGYFPTKNFYLNVNQKNIKNTNLLSKNDSAKIEEKIVFSVPFTKGYITKGDIAILNIVAANDWKRPIYFSTTSVQGERLQGLSPYLQLEGLVSRLVPIRTEPDPQLPTKRLQLDKCTDLFLNKFEFGGAERTDVNFDQTNRRMLSGTKNLAFQISSALIDAGRKEDAKKVLDHVMKNISEASFPYYLAPENFAMLYITGNYMNVGDKEKANKIVDGFLKYVDDDMEYTNTLPVELRSQKEDDLRYQMSGLGFLYQTASRNEMKDIADKIMAKMQKISPQSNQMPAPQGTK
ncbi:MAG: DUF2723 domain-containing protein [Chitinophagaceae bacterium]|nr:DUF2723 domain-containing protein [Chitinophagaceae bacterium]